MRSTGALVGLATLAVGLTTAAAGCAGALGFAGDAPLDLGDPGVDLPIAESALGASVTPAREITGP